MTVDVSVFGPVQATIGEAPVRFTSLKSAHLLGYLVVHGARPRAPMAVAEDLWPEQEAQRSRKALNTELWRLRTAFHEAGGEAPIVRDEAVLKLSPECRSDFAAFWADAVTLRANLFDAEVLVRLEAGIEAARGVLMEGCYDDWLLMPREMAVAELSRRLARLMEVCLETEQFNRAIRAALRLIDIDPLLEAPHRVIMQAQYRIGNRAAAIRQFRKLTEALRRELQVPPLEETVALYAAILGEGSDDTSAGPALPRAAGEFDAIVEDLQSAERHVRRARKHLAALPRNSTSAV